MIILFLADPLKKFPIKFYGIKFLEVEAADKPPSPPILFFELTLAALMSSSKLFLLLPKVVLALFLPSYLTKFLVNNPIFGLNFKFYICPCFFGEVEI